MLTLTATI